MTPLAILETLASRGGTLLVVEGDKLAVSPRTVLDDTIRQAIRENKPALLAALRGDIIPPDPTPTPAPCPTCRGVVHWRRAGTTALHCAACDPCTDPSGSYWYLADEWQPAFMH